MDNRRNSGSYTARIADPPVQPAPEGYSQKRPQSYRRPMDAQPMPTQTEQPAPSNPISSNSARTVAFTPSTNGVSRTTSRRRSSQQAAPASSAAGARIETPPAAPDVPRGPPPTSYRDPYAPKGSSRVPTRTYSGRSRDPTIQMNASRQQPNIQTAPDRLQELRAAPYTTSAVAGALDQIARRDSARRPSVPDRSPLQKLEGKLDDISKEERRARILEMELAAQEKAEAESAARRAREAAARQQRVVSGPQAGADRAGKEAPTRTASTRRHVSLPVPMSPELGESEGESEVGYDVSEPWDPSRTRASQPPVPRLSSGSQRQKSRLSYVEGAVARQPSVKGKEPAGVARGPSFRDRTQTSRAAPGSQPANPPASQLSVRRIERKPVPAPTGLGLYEVDVTPNASRPYGATINRYDPTALSKDLPPTPEDVRTAKPKRDSRGIMAAQLEMEQQRIDHKQGTRSFDYAQPQDAAALPPGVPVARRSVGFAPSVPEPQPQPQGQDRLAPPGHSRLESQRSQESSHHSSHHSISNIFHHEDQPDRVYVPPVMLEEWRGAPVASLNAEDLDLDMPEKPTTGPDKTWWEESQSSRRRRSSGQAQTTYDGSAEEPSAPTSFNPPLYLKCGPLLRYTGLRRDKGRTGREREVWRGSVMIVTEDDQSSYQKPPVLRLFKQAIDMLPPPPVEVDRQKLNPAYVDPIEGQTKISRTGKTLYVKPIEDIALEVDLSLLEDDNGLFQQDPVDGSPDKSRGRRKDGEKLGKMRDVPGIRLHAERGVTFWRFNLEIELGSAQTRIAYRINRGPATGFWVPAKGESMNIMFHSCNGFSLSVDSKEFCGPDPMWRDVLNTHQTRPFHVMLGGGDQIYNDAAMRQTTIFKAWTESKNPIHKHSAPFSSELQNELEQFYLDRYSMWFSQGFFGMANSQIPMVNIWDDHDIIDGFGSYPHHFMQTPVFTGLGAVAFKYYMLFQHQSVATETEKTEPSWLLGALPGPYIREQSRSVFMFLGRQIAFLGLDCRTERQRNEIVTEKSYDLIFDRLEDEIIKGETKHLLVLLGVPIAYPRLNFLENILTSRFMDPIKALGRAGLLGNFVNKFDGGVEILDDLDDHWTAKHHKEERNWFIHELQHIASTKNVRVTILGGDVHLAAMGQFYSKKKLNIPKDQDYRYMPNVISSAIVNTPPPELMADILNKRNKIHHFDDNTDEDMIPIFTHDTDGQKRNNNHLLPRRNWCSLREYKPGTTPPGTPSPPPSPGADGPRISRTLSDYTPGNMVRRMSGTGRGRDRAPPVAYYNNPTYAQADEAAAQKSSFSPDREERPRSRRNSLTSLFRRRVSVDSARPPSAAHSMPTPNRDSFPRDGDTSLERPSPFHRRPSLLGKKGLSQGGDYINLEGGLDICLNLEVSQKDPAGITTPYRLLVPALHYIPPANDTTENKARPKSRIGSMFSVFGGGRRKKAMIGDDGYSQSGSEVDPESGSELGDPTLDAEEVARQRYKVGPRILIPGITKKRDSASDDYVNPRGIVDPRAAEPRQPLPVESQQRTRQSADYGGPSSTGAPREEVRERGAATGRDTRAVSAPITSGLLTRSGSARQPTSNSSHKSQLPPVNLPSTLPAPAAQPTATLPTSTNRTAPLPSSTNRTAPLAPEPEQKVYRRSMGGILNQHRDKHFEQEAHVLAHTPSTAARQGYAHAHHLHKTDRERKRESYPPHPAIVGAGPGSPYRTGRGGGVQARDDGGYFGSGGRNGSGAGTGNGGGTGMRSVSDGRTMSGGNGGAAAAVVSPGSTSMRAGVGAKYIGRGRYAENDGGYSDDGYSFEGEGRGSVDSFVPPKPKRNWKIWK
ncbi:hypothetical protein P154DRAFT_619607 [Amniculicola lignicola CBS 123094]|uniref:PhoD-like phosphatase domain-containing protein n=1 Tax=Amniculicola lignicola CBS 123094 TaxID=1392246 RepID=A0A6A5WJT4_9PLEO|nr:hypothetical protein P154DRAFT_619607 [Amniculicola lignicola CBS 123094]